MRTSPAPLIVAILLLFPVAAAAQTYTAALLGTNETTNCDPDGTGSATVILSGTTVSYTITVNNIVLPPTNQHIHVGAAGVDGGVLIALPGTWVGNQLVGSTTASATDIAAIQANPAGHYVNVHNSPCPGGAVRGQLQFASSSTTIPTMSTWMLMALGAVMAVAGFLAVRKMA